MCIFYAGRFRDECVSHATRWGFAVVSQNLTPLPSPPHPYSVPGGCMYLVSGRRIRRRGLTHGWSSCGVWRGWWDGVGLEGVNPTGYSWHAPYYKGCIYTVILNVCVCVCVYSIIIIKEIYYGSVNLSKMTSYIIEFNVGGTCHGHWKVLSYDSMLSDTLFLKKLLIHTTPLLYEYWIDSMRTIALE